MSRRFVGKWPTDKAGNPLRTIIIEAAPLTKFKTSDKLALSQVGDAEWERAKQLRRTSTEKSPSNLAPETQIGPTRSKTRRAKVSAT